MKRDQEASVVARKLRNYYVTQTDPGSAHRLNSKPMTHQQTEESKQLSWIENFSVIALTSLAIWFTKLALKSTRLVKRIEAAN